MIFNLEKISEETAVGIFISLILLISSGILFIFYFFPDLFLKLEFSKLIILAISFVAPLLALNLIILMFFLTSTSTSYSDSVIFAASAYLSGASFYAGLFSSYLIKLSLFNNIFLILSFDLLLLVVLIFLRSKKLGK
jgi:hypothetical protein